ncbi:leucine-rich repeat domain-containing protein [Clostridium algidicarnis]|uniref:Leucine-rich repeat domain-containing protein n=1 Tax=Clostridium algidicarnis TaxID=37659 RepID=A0ABS6C580_9CLOT|nr:leucine-rich repeat domain-containing protein [Clostridium algidicarnis]MBU3220644.1 leucine-rich repeat domain-containing protein [Clostridium algidicarnis]
MRKKVRVMVLFLSVLMLFSLGVQNEAMAYVINKEEIVTPDKDDALPDEMLNWVIRCAKKKTKDYSYTKLTKEDLLQLPEIYYSEGDHYDLYEFNVFVKSIEGLQYATDTERIILPYNEISDLNPISNLTKVNKIILNCNEISNITPLENLINVTYIHLGDNELTTLEPLSKMTKLTSLNVELNHEISDISTIKNFPKLKYLNLGYNNISDINALKELKDMEDALILGSNKIQDISPIASMTKLKELDLSSNNISDISVLKNLKSLKILRLSNNSGIKDIAPLTNLTQLDKNELWLTGTAIENEKDNLFKIIDVNKLINKFKANSIIIDDKDEVANARKAFDLLPADLQKYIKELRITAAEENIDRLEKGESIKQYPELSEFDDQPMVVGDMKTLEVKVLDKSGKPLSNVNFNLKSFSDKKLTSDEKGAIKYAVVPWERYLEYKIELADKDTYTSNIEEITFKIDGTPKIVEINGQAVTGKENLKFVLTAKGEVKPVVDKLKLQSAILDAESKDANKYTEESYKQLTNALLVAKEIFQNEDATKEGVDLNTNNVIDAIAKLVEKSIELEVTPGVEPEAKPEVKPEVNTEAKPETKPEAKPEIKPEVNPEAKPKTKPEVKSVSGTVSGNKKTDNKKSSLLPKTGGLSLNMNIILGSFLTVLGMIMILFKKRN